MKTSELYSYRPVDPARRTLLATTVAVGGIGTVAAMVPFLQSMTPSEAAKAAGAPVEADLGRLEPGRLTTVEWRGRPVWILYRTEEMLATLRNNNNLLLDPQSRQSQQPPYCTNPLRAIKPQFFIATGICTHLGCVPVYRPERGAPDLGSDWPGGFYCPCHGSKFDLAGRVFKNVPAPVNLEVPEYHYLTETHVRIGESGKSA